MAAPTARPRRIDVTAAYDRGVVAYDAQWSAVIRPPAEAVLGELGLGADMRVLDVGAGTGALLPAIRSEAPAARVVALDASAEMLSAARTREGAAAVQADALALPIADDSVDAVLLAFVLFHLSDPSRGLAEGVRVLRTRGRLGAVTWAREHGAKAHAVWDAALADAGVPAPPTRRVDTGLDSCDAMEALLCGAGLRPERIWLAQLRHRWDPPSFWQLATGSGVNRRRLDLIDASTRRDLLAHLRDRLDALDPDDFAWSGEVVCTVATKGSPAAA
jgi:SAM-dependent methyltransferase